jgi:hypothetical protein
LDNFKTGITLGDKFDDLSGFVSGPCDHLRKNPHHAQPNRSAHVRMSPMSHHRETLRKNRHHGDILRRKRYLPWREN